jgi:cytochrome P450
LLRRQPDLAPQAVEEAVRFETPVPPIFRRATRAATIAGVLLVFASANRDEDRWADAGRFDVTRAPARHFGFGAGAHTCVGAALARAQARIALQTLLERLGDVRLDAEHPVRTQASINVRGPVALHLRW